MNFKTTIKKTLPNFLLEPLYDTRYIGLPEPFRTVRPHTLLSNLNLFFLQELTRRLEVAEIPGDFVECGVYRGGSAGVLANAAINSKFDRTVWLYDSFAGMPEASDLDDNYAKSLKGKYVGSEWQTRRIMQRLSIPQSRFKIIKGLFEDTLPQAEKPAIALLHVDCDFYDPVKISLETFYDYVLPGGYVVLNDYGHFQGSRMATDEFINQLGYQVNLIQIDADAYYFQKNPEKSIT